MKYGILPERGDYKKLMVYQKAECIYDITYYFAHKYMVKEGRTVDQMVQAARSGKQNIAEGCAASGGSRGTEIKLVNVAKASLLELLADYEDFLRVNGHEQWDINSEKGIQARRVCAKHNDSGYYREAIKTRSPETIANIAITLIHQEDAALRKFIEYLEREFIKNGGVREAMFKARTDYRNGKWGDEKGK